jgi:Protein of unknown function (DUF429)
VRYCGVAPVGGLLQLAMLEEVRTPEPPIRVEAAFFEPGTAAQVAAELRAIAEVVVAIAAPQVTGSGRACDELLHERGIAPAEPDAEAARLFAALRDLGLYAGLPDAVEGAVPEGAFHDALLVETSADGVFYALQGSRLPAKRHPLGIDLRLAALDGDHVVDTGGELRHRRIEELDAAAAALCAYRYALGHACWLGRREEGVVVLPGAALPDRFSGEGVLPPVERLRLPEVGGAQA